VEQLELKDVHDYLTTLAGYLEHLDAVLSGTEHSRWCPWCAQPLD
jgi:hypothetical protein